MNTQFDTSGSDQATGESILSVEEVRVLTLHGRYEVDLHVDFLRLRGKANDYKITYNSISKAFLLPKSDQYVFFILSLDTPLRQGETELQYVVIRFGLEEETSAELNMEEEEIAKYGGLKKNYEERTYEVVTSVFHALSGKEIIGSGSFQRHGSPGIKANLKAIQGDLFLLEKYVLFVSPSPSLIEHSDINQVVLPYVGTNFNARTVDLKIKTISGLEYTFSSIKKKELEQIENYLKDKNLGFEHETVPDVDMSLDEDMGGDDDDDDESDDDFQASASDSGSSNDSGSSSGDASTMSDASGDRDLKPFGTRVMVPDVEMPLAEDAGGDGDDNDDGDSDFQPSSTAATDAGSTSDSDSSSGDAATASDASGDRDFRML